MGRGTTQDEPRHPGEVPMVGPRLCNRSFAKKNTKFVYTFNLMPNMIFILTILLRKNVQRNKK